ncbi:MAG: hypothetical protein FGM33_05315 [Candidatus Kapabacteria bacterium]|nr:hypothetical protein [Candidatus Kapabacteria bacterium]
MRLNSIIMLTATAVLLSTAALAQRTDRVTTTSIFATPNGAPPADAVLKPSIKVGDLKSAIQMLQDVNIRAVEVDVFLGLRKVLSDATAAATAAGRADNAVTTVEMQVSQAQNLEALLRRVKAKGSDSTTIIDIEAALKGSVEQWKPSKKK